MERSARLYHCARCQKQVLLCRHCDHGQIYCHSLCSALSRSERVRQTKRRYQQTLRGRTKHAARQKRYREKIAKIKKVTDQGSVQCMPCDEVATSSHLKKNTFISRIDTDLKCDFCGCALSPLLRSHFLKHLPDKNRFQKPRSVIHLRSL